MSFCSSINLKCKPLKKSQTCLNVTLFYSTFRYTSYEKLSTSVFPYNKTIILGVNIKVNRLFWLVNPDNAPKTAHINYSICPYLQNSHIPKCEVHPCWSPPNMFYKLKLT